MLCYAVTSTAWAEQIRHFFFFALVADEMPLEPAAVEVAKREPTYHLVGPASSLEFAQMELLGELLRRNLPDIVCKITRVPSSDWRAFAEEVCRVQGFPPELAHRPQPISWTGAGALIGGAPEFNADCRKKFELGFDGVYGAEQWKQITSENTEEAEAEQALQLARASDERPPRVFPPTGEGAAAGLAAVTELMNGAYRFSRREPKNWTEVPLSHSDIPRVAVLLPSGGVGCPPHQLFDVPESFLFLVEAPACAPTADALEGIAYALTELRISALLVLGWLQAPELELAIVLARQKSIGESVALAPSERVWAEPMSACFAPLLAKAPPSASSEGVKEACAQEWLRAIELKLAEGLEVTRALVRHREVHIACALVDGTSTKLV
eukprot:CAMPEP_0179925570 /NCGR_PEP_ID=MMETSP0983-20121128/7329_1 /TAXON_ID=483367 /ORGANISM="non described non described, Strain CCMP 2436" /LENGTH=381 /DNA_ID=CAMNT_0021829165 /DNA_START=62 /DNA_END=1207 /DNA_ORIENTATION=-